MPSAQPGKAKASRTGKAKSRKKPMRSKAVQGPKAMQAPHRMQQKWYNWLTQPDDEEDEEVTVGFPAHSPPHVVTPVASPPSIAAKLKRAAHAIIAALGLQRDAKRSEAVQALENRLKTRVNMQRLGSDLDLAKAILDAQPDVIAGSSRTVQDLRESMEKWDALRRKAENAVAHNDAVLAKTVLRRLECAKWPLVLSECSRLMNELRRVVVRSQMKKAVGPFREQLMNIVRQEGRPEHVRLNDLHDQVRLAISQNTDARIVRRLQDVAAVLQVMFAMLEAERVLNDDSVILEELQRAYSNLNCDVPDDYDEVWDEEEWGEVCDNMKETLHERMQQTGTPGP